MKVARYRYQGRQGVGLVAGDTITPAGDDLLTPTPEGDPVALSAVQLLAPVGRNAKIIGVGLNYADHAAESGDPPPNQPLIFAKLPNSLIGAAEPILLPEISAEVDFEAELTALLMAYLAHGDDAMPRGSQP